MTIHRLSNIYLCVQFFPTEKLYKVTYQFVIFKPLSYCFQETIGFDVRALFASRPVSRLIS